MIIKANAISSLILNLIFFLGQLMRDMKRVGPMYRMGTRMKTGIKKDIVTDNIRVSTKAIGANCLQEVIFLCFRVV